MKNNKRRIEVEAQQLNMQQVRKTSEGSLDINIAT